MHEVFTTLIEADGLARALGDAELLIVDCRFELAAPAAGAAAYRAGHLPGAIYADLDRELSGPRSSPGCRHPLPAAADLAALFSRWGVGSSTQVVAYDDAGGFIAGRLWWLLRWMGHGKAAVLNGGYRAWLDAGLPVTTAVPGQRPAAVFGGEAGQQVVLDASQVAAGLAAGTLVLVDVRAAERFAGLTEPLDPVAGHVPGAINVPLSGNLDLQGRFLAPATLRARYAPILADGAQVACMCGSGVSACHTLLALEIAGLGGAALYAGSWSDWISDPGRPVATG